MSYFEALNGVWNPIGNAAGLVDLLARLEPTGVLQTLRRPTSASVLAEQCGLDEPTTAALVATMTAYDLVEEADAGLVLTAPWMALTDPGAFSPLRTLLAGLEANRHLVRGLGSVAYWELPSEHRLAMARAVSPDPSSDALVEAYRASLEADEGSRPVLDGGRFLELGCGVAGRLLLTLRASPRLTAVGVELSEDLAAEAERRAHELGLSDRFTVVCMDAGEFTSEEPFDFGFWSQFFFPEHARSGALRTMFDNLRPGGTFQAPLGTDPDLVRSDPEAAKEYYLMRLMLGSWGVPDRSPEELRAEVEDAGFVDVHVFQREVGPAVRATRPLQG